MLCTCRFPSLLSSTLLTTAVPTSTLGASSTTESTTRMLRIFAPVGGGKNRACRGASASDNSADYYELFWHVSSIAECKAKCANQPQCKGIEYHSSGRCEVWTRSEGVQASAFVSGYTCFKYSLPDPVSETTPAVVPTLFEPVDGGEGRACRGASSSDNYTPYYHVLSGIHILEDCMGKCVMHPSCKGIEHNAGRGRCEVWVRTAGIQASAAVPGFTCLAYNGKSTAATTTASVSATAVSVSTTPATSTVRSTTAGLQTWDYHPQTNCYSGAGGTTLKELQPRMLVDCKIACSSTSACQGFAVRSGFADGKSPCWLVGNVDLEACQDYPDYDFWRRLN